MLLYLLLPRWVLDKIKFKNIYSAKYGITKYDARSDVFNKKWYFLVQQVLLWTLYIFFIKYLVFQNNFNMYLPIQCQTRVWPRSKCHIDIKFLITYVVWALYKFFLIQPIDHVITYYFIQLPKPLLSFKLGKLVLLTKS